jgi:hypothetical protein
MLCRFPSTFFTKFQAVTKMVRMPKLFRRDLFEANLVRLRNPTSLNLFSGGNRGCVQKIGVVDIDPEKLMEKLNSKFPSGFDVHVGVRDSHQDELR